MDQPNTCCFRPDHREGGTLMCVCGQSWGAAVHHRAQRRPFNLPQRDRSLGTPCPLPQIGLTSPAY